MTLLLRTAVLTFALALAACGGGGGDDEQKSATPDSALPVSGAPGSINNGATEARGYQVVTTFAYTNNTSETATYRVTTDGQAKFTGTCNCYVAQYVTTMYRGQPVDYADALPIVGTDWYATPLHVDVQVPAGVTITGETRVGFFNASGPVTVQWSAYSVDVKKQ